ncbi:DNA polymerase III subunit delta [Thermophilibacter immobilis]|uniref:DNA polymerase III subunit delta n=1 Tax=Thermophilibacter immobilis TaxID=2779519 RepID=A0A7S7M9Y2_9ACTN|nr:DNA polymerase III subunit delta [Thermophilibacter immobilis]QOY61452.1 DNA polymerase III subunit delta [Thermophilibacter immobilis]
MAQGAALLPAYLAVGPDELKRRQVAARLRARVDEAFSAFDIEELTASANLDPDAVVSSLNTLPMGGSLRVVVIEGAERLPKAVSEALVAYLADPNPRCTLALLATTLAKTTRLYKAVAKMGPKAVISCAAKRGRDLPPYVQKLACSHGVSIDADAARELVARAGESTTMLDTQIRSLAALLGGSGAITRAFVEEHVARVAEVKPWEFLDRVSERDVGHSLALYHLLDGSALGLLSLVTTRLTELVCARSLAARGQPNLLAGELKKADWQVRNHVRWTRGFSDGELEGLLGACADAERALKSGADSNAVMVPLVALICGATTAQ